MKRYELNLSFDLLLDTELLQTAGLGWYGFDNMCYLVLVLRSAMLFLMQTIYIHISSFQFKTVFITQQSEFNRKIAAAFPAVSEIRRASLSSEFSHETLSKAEEYLKNFAGEVMQ